MVQVENHDWKIDGILPAKHVWANAHVCLYTIGSGYCVNKTTTSVSPRALQQAPVPVPYP